MDPSPSKGEHSGASPLPNGVPLRRSEWREATSDDFHESFGEDLRGVLDVNTWRVGADLSQEYTRIEQEVRSAVEREDVHQQRIRDHVFPKLRIGDNLPKNVGDHLARRDLIERVYHGLLFNGGVEACDGAVQVHETLPLTIYQIGVSLVSYGGDQGTWSHRLYRKDLRQECSDPMEEVLEILRRRSQRDQADRAEGGSGELIQRALIAYAERAILLRRSKAPWLMGHGNPINYELLTGGALLELMVEGTRVVKELVEKHQKFVFVASEPKERLLMSIGHALRPMEYFIVDTLDKQVERWLHQARFTVGVDRELDWDGEHISPAEWIPRFIEQVAAKIVVGLFRASEFAPAQLFYAHVDHADLAAHIVIADSRLQEHRGFPMLIEMARHVCGTVFSGTLDSLTNSAYAAAGAPWRYSRSNRGR
ncbi:MAG: hypothetical protein K2R98_34090 [Gemmataceae bacterium]|nr:hypothetical protein [Gemmataceae bacterium]